MKKKTLIIIGAGLLLSACATTQDCPDIGIAPPAKMPALPANLAQKAKRLPDMTDPTLAGVHKSGMDADHAYNELAIKYNAVIGAWDCVKKGLDARDEKLAQQCLNEISK